MWLLTALGSAVLFGLAGWWMKVSQMKGGSTRLLLFGLYASGSAGFAVHAVLEKSAVFLADWRTWAAGILIGAGSAWGNALFMKALECGPASLTSPLTNMNIVLVVAMSTWLYGEPLALAQGAGIALLLLAVVLIALKRKEPLSIKEKRWFGLVGLAVVMFALRNGGLKVTDELGLPSAPVLLVAYALSMLWFLLPDREDRGADSDNRTASTEPTRNDNRSAQAEAGRSDRRPTQAGTSRSDRRPVQARPGDGADSGGKPVLEETHGQSRPAAGDGPASAAGQRLSGASRLGQAASRTALALGLAAGAFSYGGLQLYAVAIATGQANLAAPIFATNSLVVAIGSVVWYKERLTKLQWAAFICLLAGLAVIRLE